MLFRNPFQYCSEYIIVSVNNLSDFQQAQIHQFSNYFSIFCEFQHTIPQSVMLTAYTHIDLFYQYQLGIIKVSLKPWLVKLEILDDKTGGLPELAPNEA